MLHLDSFDLLDQVTSIGILVWNIYFNEFDMYALFSIYMVIFLLNIYSDLVVDIF